jgi:tetratricopeptide (TPR) repeat protein
MSIENYEKALEYYDKGLSLGKDATLLFNRSLALKNLFKFDEGKSNYREASQLNPELVKYYNLVRETLGDDRLVMDTGLTPKEVWTFAFKSYKNYRVTLNTKWITNIATGPSFVILIAIAFTIHFFGYYDYSAAYRCGRCGSIYCKFCEKKIFTKETHFTKNICQLCHKTLVRLEELPPKTRVEMLMQIQHYKTEKSLKFKILNLLMPGAGHIYYDRSIFGILVIFPLLFFLYLLLLSLFIPPFPSFDVALSFIKGISILGLIGIYIFSSIRTLRRSYIKWL